MFQANDQISMYIAYLSHALNYNKMSFKVLLAIPVTCDDADETDYIELRCVFESREAYDIMADDNFDAIYGLLCDAVKVHKGEDWEPELGDPIEPVEFLKEDSPVDLDCVKRIFEQGP